MSHLAGCFRTDEFTTSVCSCGNDTLMDTMGDNRRRRDARRDVMMDVLDSYGLRMQKDLVQFVRKSENVVIFVYFTMLFPVLSPQNDVMCDKNIMQDGTTCVVFV